MKVVNLTQNALLSDKAAIAEDFFSRLKGLLGRDGLASGEALVITHSRSIHMFFMKFSIDAVFVDKNKVVVGLAEKIKPFQMSPIFFKAQDVIELPEGKIRETKTRLGDQIALQQS